MLMMQHIQHTHTPNPVVKFTLTHRTADHIGCYPSDQVERQVGYHGRIYFVEGLLPTTKDEPIEYGVACPVEATYCEDAEGQVQTTEVIDLSEAIPLCCHCCQPLEKSTAMGPGECRRPGCFMEQDGGEWDDEKGWVY